MKDDRFEEPSVSAEQLLARLTHARGARVSHLLLGLTGLLASTLAAALWATEPALPPTTQVVFGAFTVVGLVWAGFAGWVLSRRTPLFAKDRVVAGWLALIFSLLATAGTVLIASLRGDATAVLVGAVVGLALVTTATALLMRARSLRAALLRRKNELSGGA